MPFRPKAALLDNASGGDIVGVQQRLDANHSPTLQRPAREKDGRACRKSVALGVGCDPIADAHNLPMDVEDELAVTNSPGDTRLQLWPPDEPDVPRGRLSDRCDRAGNPNAQRPGLLSTDPRQRRLFGIAPRRADRGEVIVSPAAQLDDAIAQHPGMNHVGHARRGYRQPLPSQNRQRRQVPNHRLRLLDRAYEHRSRREREAAAYTGRCTSRRELQSRPRPSRRERQRRSARTSNSHRGDGRALAHSRRSTRQQTAACHSPAVRRERSSAR